MSKKFNDDIVRASFQMADSSALFRHVQTAGVSEFLHEDFRGNIVVSIVSPTIQFHSFVEGEIKKMLDEART